MKKYIVCYYSKDDDYCKIWVEASSEKSAEEKARREYWDISKISCVYEA